jgi:hypothetical protein
MLIQCVFFCSFFFFFQIFICFLPKGHTHIYVDQMFSRLSVAISRSGCLTPTDLNRLIRSSYSQKQGETTQEGATPKVAQVPHIYALREWLRPHTRPVRGLRHFHEFRFYLDREEKCITDFKPWCVGKRY